MKPINKMPNIFKCVCISFATICVVEIFGNEQTHFELDELIVSFTVLGKKNYKKLTV